MSFGSVPIDSNEKSDELSFHNACAKGNLSVVKVYFAQQGFDRNFSDDAGKTGFHLACHSGSLKLVQFFLQQGFDRNIEDYGGMTGFHSACVCGNVNIVQFLVQQGFDWNVGDYGGRTGFHLACVCGNLNVVQFLVQQGFDMNIGDHTGSTGFHWACRKGNLNIIKFLLRQGVDLNLGDNVGETGFHDACYYGKFNVVKFLIQHGYKGINDLGFDGTGLEMLINEQFKFYADDELFMPCILLLIEAGAQLTENYVFEEIIFAIKKRVIEITLIKEAIFEKWTGRIAQIIADFTMEPFTNTSLQNLSQFLDS